MCTVVGYIGIRPSRSFILEGLTRLEYRGYDSAGFACLTSSSRLACVKTEGMVANLAKKLENTDIDGFVGIGHTRWATHGGISAENAHPHFDCEHKIAVAHNGIIENHALFREELEAAGHVFRSQTDTETVAHLFESLLSRTSSLKNAIIELVSRLEGAYSFVFALQNFPDTIVLIRKGAPLCIGIGIDEMFVASDILAFAGFAQEVLFLPNESFVILNQSNIQLYDFSGKLLPLSLEKIAIEWLEGGKKGFEHYMLKEIYEQRHVIQQTVNAYKHVSPMVWQQLGITKEHVQSMTSLNLIGCGTSWHAARIAQFFFETIAGIPTHVHLASEFRYKSFFPERDSLYLAISQSGETADTLEPLRMLNELELTTAVLTNVASSTMVREAGGFLLMHAGPEIAVASTKAFTAQLAVLFWIAHRMAVAKGLLALTALEAAEQELLLVADVLENSIENYKYDIISKIAPFYATFKHFIFLGRAISFPFAQEAALKLKEISYIFVDTYPAGELKHGVIALVDAETPVFIFSVRDPLVYQKLLSNAQEVKARNGHLVVFAFDDQLELIKLADQVFIFPQVHELLAPLAMTGLMQFLVYQIAKVLEKPIDKPRNLAKSLTVE